MTRCLLVLLLSNLLIPVVVGFAPIPSGSIILSSRPRISSQLSDAAALSPHSLEEDEKGIVIVGGGLAGLSAALYCKQLDPDCQVTVFDREAAPAKNTAGGSPATVASMAAAGMLAPHSERLPPGPLLDLCLASRRMYPEFVSLVEHLASMQDDDEEEEDEDDWTVGYTACGGFLAPALAGDSVATWAPPESSSNTAQWLDQAQVRELEPELAPEVVGGWWFPEDASVDARRLLRSLRAACRTAGVNVQFGTEVANLNLQDGVCHGLWVNENNNKSSDHELSNNNKKKKSKKKRYVKCEQLLVANGAWMRQLLPVPIDAHKGQSLSLKNPNHDADGTSQPFPLKRALFGQDSYLCPKPESGRIVIGATVEAGSYDGNVTPAGLLHILTHALELVPSLAHWTVEETWAGLRPTTPDKAPLLGQTPWSNVHLAGGYWRNGVLLAPKTGLLMAHVLTNQPLSQSEQALLESFAWDRFTSAEKTSHMLTNARYAASMHPVHTRALTSNSLGETELGAYSNARKSRAERQADMDFVFNDDGDNEEALEEAIRLGKQDAQAFSFGPVEKSYQGGAKSTVATQPLNDDLDRLDALTIGDAVDSTAKDNGPRKEDVSEKAPSSSGDDVESIDSPLDDLDATYAVIMKNKEMKGMSLEDGESSSSADDENDDREDPGYRIYYHPDPDDNDLKFEIPPFTRPEEFRMQLEKENLLPKTATDSSSAKAANDDDGSTGSGGGTFDGYQDIQKANSRSSREAELDAMREARRKNRIGAEEGEVDVSKIGAGYGDAA